MIGRLIDWIINLFVISILFVLYILELCFYLTLPMQPNAWYYIPIDIIFGMATVLLTCVLYKFIKDYFLW